MNLRVKQFFARFKIGGRIDIPRVIFGQNHRALRRV